MRSVYKYASMPPHHVLSASARCRVSRMQKTLKWVLVAVQMGLASLASDRDAHAARKYVLLLTTVQAFAHSLLLVLLSGLVLLAWNHKLGSEWCLLNVAATESEHALQLWWRQPRMLARI